MRNREDPAGKRALTAVAVAVALLVSAAEGPSAVAQPGEVADEPSNAYTIGIQDNLKVSVYGEPELSLSVPVRPDGRISLPLIQDVLVAGLTPREAAAEIRDRLQELIKDPEVTVIVTAINSFPVYVLGEVTSQGVYQFQRPTRLFQALATAGGLNDFASGKVIVVRAKSDGSEMRFEVDYEDFVKGRDDARNPFLRPGDTILVD